MPYTLRHFLFSPRVRRFGDSGDRFAPGLVPGATKPPFRLDDPDPEPEDEDEMSADAADDEDWVW